MLKRSTIYTAAWVIVLLLTQGAAAQTIFRDDFNRDALGPAWRSPEYARWTLANGRANNRIDGVGGTLQTAAAFPQTAYVIESHAFPFVRNYQRTYAITFGKPNPDQDFGYIVRYNSYINPQLRLGRSDGNEFYPTVLDDSSVVLDMANEYTFRIERTVAGLIRVFVNDGSGYSAEPVLQAVDTTYAALGHFGWRVDTETFAEDFSVDWIEARYPAGPAPSLLTNVQTTGDTPYNVGQVAADSLLYVDRSYVFTAVPDFLKGAAYVRTANANKGRSDTAHVAFDLTEEANLYVFYDPRGTRLPGWMIGWEKISEQVYSTDSGTNVLDIYTKTYGAGRVILGGNLEAFGKGALTNYLVAALPAPAGTVLEAEKAFLDGPEVEARHRGYSGAGYADFRNSTGDSITWTVNATLAGQYELGFRYALGNVNRSLVLKVNGAVADTALTFPASGNWAAWQLVRVSAQLQAGANTVTLVASGKSGPNFDYLMVKSEQVTPPAARPRTTKTPEVLAEASALLGSYPNPTTGLTTFRYRLAEASPVSLVLYNARGQRVATLLDHAHRSAGVHEQPFDARQVPGGVYFYRLQAGATQRVARMIVNR
ncbi:MAG: T9SS type A sorting domain-containing protein [Cytophagales bacterium]|nr:T9SS type A sorting domain-containing protein [Cytophagales bacterium]